MTAAWGKPCHMQAVKCPHCGKPNDFSEVSYAIAEEETTIDETKARPTVFCDHCDGLMEVTKVMRTTLVWVRPSAGGANHQVFAAGQVVFACAGCKAEFYDALPTTNSSGQPIPPGVCPTCSDALSKV